MRTFREQIEVEIIHEPEHFNPRCGCTIPGAWTAFFSNSQPKWPCGDTYEEALRNVRAEYPNAVIS